MDKQEVFTEGCSKHQVHDQGKDGKGPNLVSQHLVYLVASALCMFAVLRTASYAGTYNFSYEGVSLVSEGVLINFSTQGVDRQPFG